MTFRYNITIFIALAYLFFSGCANAAYTPPGGSNTSVQFNNGGTSFGGDTGFVYSSGKVGIGSTTPANALDVGSGGVHLGNSVPSSTSSALYNSSGALYWNGTPVGVGTSVSLAIGGTTVTGGTNNYILFNNAGVLGNEAAVAITGDVTIGTTGTSTVVGVQGTSVGAPTGTAGTAVVLATSPTITTPTISTSMTVSGTTPTISLTATGGPTTDTIQNSSGLLQFNTGSNNAIVFNTGSTERARITSSGVSIGTSSSGGSLTVGSTGQYTVSSAGNLATSGTATFSGLNVAGYVTNTSGGLLGTTTGATAAGAVTFDSSGNATVSIGTSSLNSTGTANSTTFLRGDNTWSAVTGVVSLTAASTNISVSPSPITGTGTIDLGAAITPATSVTSPLMIGGTGAGSTLTVESTSGAGTTDAIIFQTASQSEKMRLFTGGTLGIGTTSISTSNKLEVNGSMSIGTTAIAAPTNGLLMGGSIYNSGGGSSSAPVIAIGATNTGFFGSGSIAAVVAGAQVGGFAAGHLMAGTTNSAKGFASGSAYTQTHSTSTTEFTNGYVAGSWNATAASGGVFGCIRSKSGTVGTQSATTTSDVLCDFEVEGSDGTAMSPSSRIQGVVDASVSTGIVPGRLSFSTANGSGTMTEALRINSAQLLTLPQISTDATHTDSTLCQDTTTHGVYFGSGTAGVCLGTSSERFKNSITNLPYGLAEINKLRPVRFYYNKDHGDGGASPQYGLIAEEVVKVLPELVRSDVKGKPNSVDLLGTLPIALHAIQEQQKEIDDLRNQINEMKGLQLTIKGSKK